MSRSMLKTINLYVQQAYKCQLINKRYFQKQFSNLGNLRSIASNRNQNLGTEKLDRDFIDKFGSNPNQFGTLNVMSNPDLLPNEEGDKEEMLYYDPQTRKRRLSITEYANLIKDHLKNKQIREAIDVLEIKMLKEDKVKPENYIYNILIGGCAKVGYTQKAFQLFNRMKNRGLKVTGDTYTCLFNACALDPFKNDGLSKAQRLRELMLEKGYMPNMTNYHAMIKAFGYCGDLMKSFKIVDEMKDNGIYPNNETYNFLLQACISDDKSGFRHAIHVWRKMLFYGIKPTIYSYNLLLRCIRDCGIGDIETFMQEIQNILDTNKLNLKEINRIYTPQENSEIVPSPNILMPTPFFGDLLQMRSLHKSRNRLMLVGGVEGVIDQMLVTDVKPNENTTTLLIEIIPSTLESENLLIDKLLKHNIKLQTSFCNVLIKRRNKRHDFNEAKNVLNLMNKYNIQPDIITYGVLALGCENISEAKQLINDIECSGFAVNIEILGALLCRARHAWDIPYIFYVMNKIEASDLKTNQIINKHLNGFKTSVAKQIKLKNKGLDCYRKVNDNGFLKKYAVFCEKYEQFCKKIEFDNSDSLHPWKQFKKN